MSRAAILTLRVFAVGSALTIFACHVAHKQQQAAVAGDRGAPGAEAGSPERPATHMPGSKSRMVITAPDLKAPEKPAPPPPETHIMGTKSGLIVSPRDVQQAVPLLPPPDNSPPRRFAPGSKSARMVSPADVQELQQRATPVQQTNDRQQ